MTLSTQDYTSMLAMLDRLSDTESVDDFVTALLDGLRTIVGSDSIGYEEIRPSEGSALRISQPIEAARPDLWEAFAAHFHEHPMVARLLETGDERVHLLSDFLSDRELRQTGLHAEVLHPAGIRHQTGFSLAGDHAPFVAVTLARGEGSDFSARDVEILEALRRPIRRLREAVEKDTILRTLETSGSAAVVVVGLDGRAVWVSPRAKALAQDHALELERGRGLPLWCLDVVATGVPEVFGTDGSRIRIRALPSDGNGTLPALLLEPLPGPPSRRDLARLDLSRRETDVLVGLLDGHSNDEIAADLVISVRTVRKHLEAIYDKLGVHSRSEAVAVAYQSARAL